MPTTPAVTISAQRVSFKAGAIPTHNRVILLNALDAAKTTNPKEINALITAVSTNHGNSFIIDNPQNLPYLVLYSIWEGGTDPTALAKLRCYGEVKTPSTNTNDAKQLLPKALDNNWGDIRPVTGNVTLEQWIPLPSAITTEFEFEIGEIANPVHMQVGNVKFSREHIVSTRGCDRLICTMVSGIAGPTRASVIGHLASINNA